MLRALLLAAGLALLGLLVAREGPALILGLLAQVGWGFLPVAALYLGHQLLRAFILTRCLPEGHPVRYPAAVRVRLAGEAISYLTFTGPFVSEPSKGWLLGRLGVAVSEGMAATLAEYLVYTWLSAALMCGGLGYLVSTGRLGASMQGVAIGVIAAGLVFLVTAAVAVWRRTYLIGAIARGVSRLPIARLRTRSDPAEIRRMEDQLLGLLRDRPGRLAEIAALEAMAHAMLVLELAWIAHLSGVELSIGRAVLIEAAAKITQLAFFFVPAQAGVMEGVNLVAFRVFGYSGAVAIAISLVRRLRSLLVAGLGLAALVVHRRLPERPPPAQG
jgi:putative effector of murein hydrolase LrgA (UPF0299 family)